MKSFKDFIIEESQRPLSANEVAGKVGKTRWKSIVEHPWYKKHVSWEQHTVYKHHIDSLGHHNVEAYPFSEHDKKEDGKYHPKKMIRFQTYKHRVVNAHEFHNAGMHNGRTMWDYKKSHKSDDVNENVEYDTLTCSLNDIINDQLFAHLTEDTLTPESAIQKIRTTLHKFNYDFPALYDLDQDGDELAIRLEHLDIPPEDTDTNYLYLIYSLSEENNYEFHAEIVSMDELEEIIDSVEVSDTE